LLRIDTIAEQETLNLFYAEPDPDRWIRFDRYPRRVVRRLIRGKRNPGGQERVFLNLCAGLDKIGVPYRVNDYGHAKSHPDEIACIVGKPHLLDATNWQNPILFGAAVFSHPIDDPDLLKRKPVRRILVPGEWIRAMFEPYFGDKVIAWPVGIDTERWSPSPAGGKDLDFLLYDKVRWDHESFDRSLIDPVREALRKRGLSFTELRYGSYREAEFEALLARCRAMIFLCEHETQGIAYQQALSAGVPILAWDRGGYWQDPTYYPARVKFGPVSSVPYWDERCGVRFRGPEEFDNSLELFLTGLSENRFTPREFILEDLTLERCAQKYVDIWRAVKGESSP
jgi:glycosyltransferase involved in cell wall biosynthesis